MTSADAPGAFTVVERIGPAAVFAGGPKPRGPSDRHGAVDVDGERHAVLVQTGSSWPPSVIVERGRALRALAAHPNIARTFFFDSARNRFHHVIERRGGVALPALVRKLRRRPGALPVSFVARIVRDFVRVQIDLAALRELSLVVRIPDALVTWDGALVVAQRLFGAAADRPAWCLTAERHARSPASTNGAARLLFALLAPIGDGADVDATLSEWLASGVTQLRFAGIEEAPALRELLLRGLSRSITLAEIARQLDDVTKSVGDNPAFAASLMAELFRERRAADLAWREELAAADLTR